MLTLCAIGGILRRMKWTTAQIEDQTGKTFLVTGANSGLGYVTTRELAAKGAHVIMAVRNVQKGRQAMSTLSGSLELKRVSPDAPYPASVLEVVTPP